MNRQKLLQRLLGLRATRLCGLVARLWPDACQDDDSDLAMILGLGNGAHAGPWTTSDHGLPMPQALGRLLDMHILRRLDVRSGLIAAALATMLIATAPEEFGIPECTDTLEAAGLAGPHRWGLILPQQLQGLIVDIQSHSRSALPGIVVHGHNPIQIGHFVSHEHTIDHGGFRTIFWDAPKDLRTAVDDIVVVMLEYLRRQHREFRQGATTIG